MDRAIHMALGCEVQHCAWLVLCQQLRHQAGVANVALHKHMTWVVFKGFQVGQIARVGELVEVDDLLVGTAKPGVDKIAADEAGAAGDKDGHFCLFTWIYKERSNL